jgi:hypothetical protein
MGNQPMPTKGSQQPRIAGNVLTKRRWAWARQQQWLVYTPGGNPGAKRALTFLWTWRWTGLGKAAFSKFEFCADPSSLLWVVHNR